MFSGDARREWYSKVATCPVDWRLTGQMSLYQRKKGRDLFDLQVAFESRKIDVDKVLECYRRYIEFVVEKQPTYKQFVQNMELKMQDPEFLGDTDILLREGTNPFKPQEAYQLVKEQFIDKMPGKRD